MPVADEVQPAVEPSLTLSQAYRTIWDFSGGYRLQIAAAGVLGIIVSTLSVVGPMMTARFFHVFEGAAPAAETGSRIILWTKIPLLPLGGHNYLSLAAPFVLLIAAAATLLCAVGGAIHSRFEEANRLALTLRSKRKVYGAIHNCHVLNPQRPTGELMAVLAQCEGLAGLVPFLVINPVTYGWQLAFAVLAMAAASWWLTAAYLAVLLSIGLLMPRLLGMDQRVASASNKLRDISFDEANVVAEQLAARDLIEALGVQKAAETRAMSRFIATTSGSLKLVWMMQLRGLATPLATISFPILVLLGAAWGTNLSNILQIWMLSGAVTGAMQGLMSLAASWQQSKPNLGFLCAELDRQPPAVVDKPLFAKAPEVRVENVSADLPDGTPILKGLSLKAEAGHLTAIVGRGGTGKSLLLDVISGRFLGALRGQVAFDGTTVPAERLVDYRTQIARLNQTPQTLRMTVAEFITFGVDGAPERSVEESLDMVGLATGAPEERRLDPADTISVDRRLSGLQQQCMRLAQVLVRPRQRLFLLDEPDSAMSPEDAAFVQRVIIQALTGESTVLMVTHAPHLLPAGTRIAFLKDGKVEAMGTHHELLAKSPAYGELVHDLEESATAPAEEEEEEQEAQGTAR